MLGHIESRVTLYIVIINIIAFAMQYIFGDLTEFLALNPLKFFSGNYWQLFTYMFMHAGFMHIFFNMFVFLIFGTHVELALGSRKYVILYFLAGMGSALFYLWLGPPPDVILLGASGAIFGVMAAYAFLFPKSWILIFPGIPLPAVGAIIFITLLETFSGLFGLSPGIANFGHLGGIITGLIFMSVLRLLKRRKEKGIGDFEYVWETEF